MLDESFIVDEIDRGSEEFTAYLKDAGKTLEEFDTEVLSRVTEFCEKLSSKLHACLISQRDHCLYLTIGVHDFFDDERDEKASDLEISLVENGWLAFSITPLPLADDDPLEVIERLRDFTEFADGNAREL